MLRRALACSRRAVHVGHEITSNGYGVMMADHDRFEAAWVTAASQLDLECCALELGAAFGRATLDALVQGCPHVVCNDLDASHLAEVERRFRSSNAVGSLTTLCGRVPSTLEGWEPPSPLRAVLAANILHFLHPKEAQLTLSRLHDICAEGAELFVSLDAPWTQSFRPLWPLFGWRPAPRLHPTCRTIAWHAARPVARNQRVPSNGTAAPAPNAGGQWMVGRGVHLISRKRG